MHKGQRQEKNYNVLDALIKLYDRDWENYRKELFAGRITHEFRNGRSDIIGQLTPEEVRLCRKQNRRYRLKYKLRRYFEKFLDHL